MKRAALLAVLCLTAACGGSDEAPSWADVRSNDGRYLVRFRPAPEDMPLDAPFSMDVDVRRTDAPDRPADDVEIQVEAVMPEHGHGMNVTPSITRQPDGTLRVDGMLLHMTGRWELHVDVTRGALTERAQADVVLSDAPRPSSP